MSDYNIVQKTPYGKDIIKLLAAECRKQESSYFYYSLLDWNRDDYFPEEELVRYSWKRHGKWKATLNL